MEDKIDFHPHLPIANIDPKTCYLIWVGDIETFIRKLDELCNYSLDSNNLFDIRKRLILTLDDIIDIRNGADLIAS